MRSHDNTYKKPQIHVIDQDKKNLDSESSMKPDALKMWKDVQVMLDAYRVKCYTQQSED